MVTDATVLTVTAISAVTAITMTGVCFMHIDGAFMASMASIIAGLTGYKVGEIKASKKVT